MCQVTRDGTTWSPGRLPKEKTRSTGQSCSSQVGAGGFGEGCNSVVEESHLLASARCTGGGITAICCWKCNQNTPRFYVVLSSLLSALRPHFSAGLLGCDTQLLGFAAVCAGQRFSACWASTAENCSSMYPFLTPFQPSCHGSSATVFCESSSIVLCLVNSNKPEGWIGSIVVGVYCQWVLSVLQ